LYKETWNVKHSHSLIKTVNPDILTVSRLLGITPAQGPQLEQF